MNKFTPPLSVLFFSISSVALLTNAAAAVDAQSPGEVEAWFGKLTHSHHPKEKLTKLRFYFHDLLDVKNLTAVVIAKSNVTASSPTFFGAFVTADDPLTAGPAFSSKRVGYARGFYGGAAMEEVGLVFAITFVFTEGEFNGSTLAVLGHNPYHHVYREMPIVGGTGVFRLARGTSTWETYFFDPAARNATIEISVSVLHY